MEKAGNRIFGLNVPITYLLGSSLFILINSIALFYGIYAVSLVSVVLLIAFYSLFEFEKLYFFIVFITPFSIGLQWLFPNISFDLSMPSEPLMLLLLFIIILKSIYSGILEFKILKHPVSIAVFIYLFWILFTSITSSMPLVSLKYFISKLWFILPMYFFPVLLFRKKRNIFLFWGLYIISFSLVIAYTINNHLTFGLFDKKAAHFVMQPFYNDHTSYGAILAMFIPVLFGLIFFKELKPIFRTIIMFVFIFFAIAIVLSYTRAAWISVVGAGIFAALILFKVKIKYMLFAASIIICILFIYRIEIIDKLSKNKQDSSAELIEHVQSMSNIATDASNLERVNRWNSALKMFVERPFLGWGPGTYMFQYAPFQMARDKTIISTNFGEGGNAHSEYIGPLAEQGVLGLITFVILLISIIGTGLKTFQNSNSKSVKLLSLVSLLALSTYFIHGLLNNYLDTDKASVPFWGFIAILVSLDLYQLDGNKNPQLGGAEER